MASDYGVADTIYRTHPAFFNYDCELPDCRKEFYEHITLYQDFLSSVDPTAHFGLGKLTTIKNLKVTWPGGRVQILPTVNADQTLIVDAKNARSGGATPVTIASTSLFEDVTAELGITYKHKETNIIDFKLHKTLVA